MSAQILPALSPSPAEGGLLSSLLSRPSVEHQLHQRGVELQPIEGERADGFENRMGTALMALFRDTRAPEAFEALYAFARPAVQQWIRGLLHRGLSHLDPNELLQDTFVNVYRYPGAFRDDHAGSFRVWVRTIAGNIVRRASSIRTRMLFIELPEGSAEPEDRRETPASQALASEQNENLRGAWILLMAHYAHAWEQLAPRDRQTLHMVEVQGLSYAEAGAELNVGRSNMKMIVFRARKRITRLMRQAMNASVMLENVEAA
jgi:RNA polymerase sigma factor (sigma-70 family)